MMNTRWILQLQEPYSISLLIVLFFPLQESRLRTLTHLQTPVKGSSCPSPRSSEGFAFSEKDVCAVLPADTSI